MNKTLFTAYALVAVLDLCLACTRREVPMSGSPAGCSSSLDRKHSVVTVPRPVTHEVRVGDDTCKEDRSSIADAGEYVTLDCSGDGGTIRVLFPRKEWHDILRDRTGSVPTPVGK